jgi:exosortase
MSWLPTFLAVGFLWLIVLNQQRLEWSVNPVYSYGWVVPALALYLFWARWQSRPAPGRPLATAWFIAGVVAVLVAYLPVRVVQEGNPDWVKINWLMAGLWVALSVLTLARLGGARYVLHFIFPILFCYTALPWPVWMEESLVQVLMRFNAEVSAETLTMLGTPALAQGNLVQIADQWVNVEEACSGIRSLQTAFMMSLFLGEFYRMGWVRRGILLAASFAVAFIVNLGRTLLLTNFAKTNSVDEWHDTVGLITMGICLVALWALAETIKTRETPAAQAAKDDKAKASVTGPSVLRPPFSMLGAVVVCAGLVVAEAASWSWYYVHERNLPPPIAWDMTWPKQAPAFQEGEFAERMRALLKFNDGRTASWKSEQGYQWQMYYLEWQPGRVSKFLSSAHYPTVCLPATGLTLVSETGVWRCQLQNTQIPFTTYMFDESGRDVYVFHAIIEDRPVEGGTELSYRQVASNERLDSVLRGERNLGQRVVGIALRGPLTPLDARMAVAAALDSMISLRSPDAGTKIAYKP